MTYKYIILPAEEILVNKKTGIFHKILHTFLSLLLVFYSFAPGLLYAQEATSSAQNTTPAPSASATAAPTASPEVSSSPSIEPTVNSSTESAVIVSPSPEASPSKTAATPTASDSPVSSPNENREQSNAPPTNSPFPSVSPSPSPSTQPTVIGHLSASIIKNETVNAVSLDLDPINTNTSASLTTDKADYSPTDTVIVSGTDFMPEVTYTLKISSADPPPVDFQTEVTTDGKGSFNYSYQLDGTYRPNYKAEAKDKNGNVVASVSFTDTEVPSDMVSWWKGEDNANDSEGLNNGSLINGTTFADGKVGRAFSFDGVDDYIEVPHAASLNLTSGLTLETWFKLRSAGGAALFSKSDFNGSESVTSYSLAVLSNGSINVALYGTYPADNWSTTAGLVTTGQWYHVALTWDGTYGPSDNVKLYLNGVLVGTWTKSSASLNVTTQTLTLGSMKPPTYYHRTDGLLDEMKIFNRALSADEISATYNADTEPVCVTPPSGMTSWWPGDGNTDDIAGTNNGTLVGGATYADGKVGQAFSFDGTDDWVAASNVGDFGSDFFTVDFWMKSNNDGSSDPTFILGKNHANGGLGWDIRLSNSTIRVVGVNGWGFNITSDASATPNVWHHIVLTSTNTEVNLYIDGVSKGTSPRSTITSTSNPFRIGFTTDFNSPAFNGLIDEVEIFDRALSQDEIVSIYNADSAGKCKEESTPTGTITIEKVVEGGDVPSSNWSFNILGDQGTVESDLHDGDSVTLPTGTYTISESTINGYTLTDATGACSNFDGSNATLTVTEEGGTCTLTNTADPARIRAFKYFDLDQNGSYDGEDYPLEGWRIILYDDRGGTYISDKATGADGYTEYWEDVPVENPNELVLQEDPSVQWGGEGWETRDGYEYWLAVNPADRGGGGSGTYWDGEVAVEAGGEHTFSFGNWQDSDTDRTPPEVTSADTKDIDRNGQIDAVELTFTEDIDDNMLDTLSSDGWDVDGYDNEIISTGETGYDNTLLLTFSESGQSDTATTPYVSYSSSGNIGLTSTHDLAGNELESGNWSTSDGAAPVSSFSSPEEGSFWNDLIEISGSSSDMDILGESDTVDYVTLYYSLAGEDDWEEIDQVYNEGAEPFEWESSWEPEEEGAYDFKAEATDISGNTEESPVVRSVVYDTTKPESDITYPEEGVNYSQEQWDGKILTEAEDALSGIARVLVSMQRDSDNKYWDGADDEDGTGWRSSGEEYLNEATLGEDGSWSFDFSFIEPEGGDEGYTVRSHGVDNAENKEDTAEVHFYFGRPPVISGEAESSVSQTSATIKWTTDFQATSRVLYDTVSHPVLGAAPNYGYANSTTEADTDPKVTLHSVLVSGLSSGTTYYYRMVSHGSPEAVGDEKSFKTLAPISTATTNTTGSGTGDGLSDGLGCGSHDCSGNVISSPSLQVQTSGVSIALSEFPQEILGATAAVEESSDEQVDDQVDDQVIEEVKGEQTIGETGEPQQRTSLFGGIIKNSFGLIILIIVIILTYSIYRMRLRRKDQN